MIHVKLKWRYNYQISTKLSLNFTFWKFLEHSAPKLKMQKFQFLTKTLKIWATTSLHHHTGSAFSWVKYESLRLAIKVRPFGSNQNKWREIFNILIEVYDLWNLIEEPSSHFDKACQQKYLHRVLNKFWDILKNKSWVLNVEISWF